MGGGGAAEAADLAAISDIALGILLMGAAAFIDGDHGAEHEQHPGEEIQPFHHAMPGEQVMQAAIGRQKRGEDADTRQHRAGQEAELGSAARETWSRGHGRGDRSRNAGISTEKRRMS